MENKEVKIENILGIDRVTINDTEEQSQDGYYEKDYANKERDKLKEQAGDEAREVIVERHKDGRYTIERINRDGGMACLGTFEKDYDIYAIESEAIVLAENLGAKLKIPKKYFNCNEEVLDGVVKYSQEELYEYNPNIKGIQIINTLVYGTTGAIMLVNNEKVEVGSTVGYTLYNGTGYSLRYAVVGYKDGEVVKSTKEARNGSSFIVSLEALKIDMENDYSWCKIGRVNRH